MAVLTAKNLSLSEQSACCPGAPIHGNLGQERLSSMAAFSLLPVGDTIATKKPPLPSSNFGLQYKKFSFEGIRVPSPPTHIPFSRPLLLKAKSLCVRGTD